MTKKISQLPAATTPLSGAEVLPLMQSGVYRKAGIGVAQILEPFGDLPTNMPVGKVIYVPDAAGGAVPAYWDGTEWRAIGGGGDKVKPIGEGIWFLAIGASLGPTHFQGHDIRGVYFTSVDGFTWEVETLSVAGTIIGTAYANGMWVVSGQDEATRAYAISSVRPNDETQWVATPPSGYYTLAAEGTTAQPANAYDNATSEFTVPISGGSPQTIFNFNPRAVTPDPTWPHVGVDNTFGTIEEGMGTRGVVEVRIKTTRIEIVPFGIVDGELVPAGWEGVYDTDYVQYRPMGTSQWLTVNLPFLNAYKLDSVGLVLNSLVWGPIKDSAVRFLPGSN